jgi:hypothetical protein
MQILVIFFAAVALVAVLTVTTFRFVVRRCGMKDLIENGAVLTDDGVEYLRMFLFGRGKIKFNEIESVKLVSFPVAMLSLIFPFRYGFSVHSIRTRLFSDFVEIKIKKPSRWFEFHFDYLLFTPKDAASFVERLKSRLSGYENHVASYEGRGGGWQRFTQLEHLP